MPETKPDLYIFGSTSEIMRQLVRERREWLQANTRRVILSQRGATPAEYEGLNATVVPLDCADPRAFRAGLTKLVQEHVDPAHPKLVISTYGKFSWDYAPKSPVFRFTDEGHQVNLVSRLQVIDAFRAFASTTRFHLFGSLFANFPYLGDYALCMWAVNQLPQNPEYRDLNLIVTNIGGCKTRFWDHASMGTSNPFLHDVVPTKELFEAVFQSDQRGVVTFYPSVGARIACALGRMGVRVL
ncbi:hypothetical protein L6R49_17130 [Myxococcota bacterium]|nr:hypothetical protein [Myxococcota bacterium]